MISGGRIGNTSRVLDGVRNSRAWKPISIFNQLRVNSQQKYEGISKGERVSLSGSETNVSRDGGLWPAHPDVDMRIRPGLPVEAAVSYAEGYGEPRVGHRLRARPASVAPLALWKSARARSLKNV